MAKIETEANYHFLISAELGKGLRLDRFLSEQLPELSRSRLQQLIKEGHATINNNTVKPKHKLIDGDEITLIIPAAKPLDEVEAQDIPLEVLYEDEDFIVINKAPGMVVHPAAGNPDGTLVNALLHHCRGELSGIGGIQRPGIVHRLDKETSGCLVAAKNDAAHQEISRQFADRETTKIYHCVVQGIPTPANGTIENQLGRHPVNRQKMAVLEEPKGKRAVTDYKILRQSTDANLNWAFIECHLHTGRTHQIRVHMKSLTCPILGDVIYAQAARQKVKTSRMLLHASNLGFTHPISGLAVTFTAPLPEEFQRFAPATI